MGTWYAVRMESEHPFKIGRYGAGTLSLLRNEAGQFILIGAMTIARRSKDAGTWISFAPGWRVTAEGGDAVRVTLGDDEGAVVSALAHSVPSITVAPHTRYKITVSIYIDVAGRLHGDHNPDYLANVLNRAC